MDSAPTLVGVVGVGRVPGQYSGRQCSSPTLQLPGDSAGRVVCKAEEGRTSVVEPMLFLAEHSVVEVGRCSGRSTAGIYGEMEVVLVVSEVVDRYLNTVCTRTSEWLGC